MCLTSDALRASGGTIGIWPRLRSQPATNKYANPTLTVGFARIIVSQTRFKESCESRQFRFTKGISIIKEREGLEMRHSAVR